MNLGSDNKLTASLILLINSNHLDLDSFKIAKNPKLLIKIHKNDKKYGQAIRELRESCDLNQDEIGLSDKQIRRFENGESRPTLSALKKMAHKHSMSIEDYLNKLSSLLI